MQLRATRLTAIATAVRSLFKPLSLFANGEQGVWYDPSDLTTLFQDAAGTTPVTAVEQPVGLMLDKSKGLVLGSELVTNGNFSNGTTGWTANTNTTISVSSGAIRVTNDGTGSGNAYQQITVAAGRWYQVSVQFVAESGANQDFRIGTTIVGIDLFRDNTTNSGVITARFLATASTIFITLVAFNSSAAIGSFVEFDNISVRELPGNHAFQSTSAARPVLSARVNLLTKTEQFDDAVWSKVDATITANTDIAPDQTLSSDKIVENSAFSTHYIQAAGVSVTAQPYTFSFYAKAAERTAVGFYDANGNVGRGFVLTGAGSLGGTLGAVAPTNSSIILVGNGWYRCTATWTPSAGTVNPRLYPLISTAGATYQGDGTSGLFIWGADLRVANTGVGLPDYQRVNTSTDYDTAGFPLYIQPNGSSQWMQTNSIDFSATDKMTVVAGVRKLSDAAVALFAELSASLGTNNGTFYLAAPINTSGNTLAFASRGSLSSAPASTVSPAFTAPITSVLTGLGDISGDQAILRVNGTQAASSTADQGTGNYGNYPLYLFARAGTNLWFGGRFYGLIARGAQTADVQIRYAEAWMNTKTKAY